MEASATTEGEKRVLDEAPSGKLVDLGDVSEDQRVVSADVIRRLCVGPEAKSVDPRGIRIKNARIAGALDLSFGTVAHPLLFEETTFLSAPDLSGAHLPALSMTGCVLPGLACDGLRLEGDLCLNSSEVSGEVQLRGARVDGLLECEGAKLVSEGGDALTADGAEIDGGVFLRGPFSAVGTVRFPRARIGSDFDCAGATFRNENSDALVLDGAEIGGYVVLRGVCATGCVQLPGARVGGDVSFVDARLSNEGMSLPDESGGGFADHAAVFADKAEIRGSVYLDDIHANGVVQLVRARIAGDLHCDRATLSNEAGYALWAERAEIGGTVRLMGSRPTGEVRLIGAKIGGDLFLNFAELVNTRWSDSLALEAKDTVIGGSLFLRRVEVSGGVDLCGARAATLVDDLGSRDSRLGSWDGAQPLILDDFAYTRFGHDATWDLRLRKHWLKATTGFQQAAWQQLIAVYRARSLDDEAARTAIALQDDRLARAGLPWYRRAGRIVLWAVVGHGYRPWLAGAWAVGIIAAFAFVVWNWSAMLVPNQGVAAAPQPVAYAADVFLPIVNLGQADDYTATHWLRWVEWTVILLGWALTTLFVAGFTRVVRNE